MKSDYYSKTLMDSPVKSHIIAKYWQDHLVRVGIITPQKHLIVSGSHDQIEVYTNAISQLA